MLNRFDNLVDSLPTLISNTHVDVHLEGWPAATTAVSFAGAIVAIIHLILESRRREDDYLSSQLADSFQNQIVKK